MAEPTNDAVSDERLREIDKTAIEAARKAVWAVSAHADRSNNPKLAAALAKIATSLNRRSVTSQASEGEVVDRMVALVDENATLSPDGIFWTVCRPHFLGDVADYRALFASPSKRVERLETATHRHVKRGSEYVLIGYGKMQAQKWKATTIQPDEVGHNHWTHVSIDMREVAIYRSVDDGSLWVRPREEFEDGRFQALQGGRS